MFLPELGGYAGQVLARYWVPVPGAVSDQDAAALPASGEAAARVVDETGVAAGETVLVAGAAGSVGLIATQLAVARGARVLAAVRPADFGLVARAGAMPVGYGPSLAADVRAVFPVGGRGDRRRRRGCARGRGRASGRSGPGGHAVGPARGRLRCSPIRP